MRVQYNKQTHMTWAYIPTSVAKTLDIGKDDEIEYTRLEGVGAPLNEVIFLIKKKIKTVK